MPPAKSTAEVLAMAERALQETKSTKYIPETPHHVMGSRSPPPAQRCPLPLSPPPPDALDHHGDVEVELGVFPQQQHFPRMMAPPSSMARPLLNVKAAPVVVQAIPYLEPQFVAAPAQEAAPVHAPQQNASTQTMDEVRAPPTRQRSMGTSTDATPVTARFAQTSPQPTSTASTCTAVTMEHAALQCSDADFREGRSAVSVASGTQTTDMWLADYVTVVESQRRLEDLREYYDVVNARQQEAIDTLRRMLAAESERVAALQRTNNELRSALKSLMPPAQHSADAYSDVLVHSPPVAQPAASESRTQQQRKGRHAVENHHSDALQQPLASIDRQLSPWETGIRTQWPSMSPSSERASQRSQPQPTAVAAEGLQRAPSLEALLARCDHVLNRR